MLGISLLEVMLSLSIIAIILTMATRYFFVASNNDKINTTVSQIGGLIGAAHSWKGAGTNFSGLSIAELADAGQLTNFPGFNNSAESPALSTMWGGHINISTNAQEGAGLAMITVPLPAHSICHAINRAYPTDNTGNITATCQDTKFTYTFP